MTTRLAALVALVQANLNDATVAHVIGRSKEGQHGQRRRVHWYRVGGDVVPGERAGGGVEGTGEGTTPDEAEGTRSPAVWQRLEEVECVIFAESDETAETLLDNLIVAIDHAIPNGGAEFRDYTWQENEIAQRVPLCRLNFRAKMPIPDQQKALVEITAEELTCEWEIP